MTTIEFGGGPSLEARRQFANLKDGSQVPKYTGHIHHLRFRQGHTYGEETHRLSKQFPHLLPRSKSDIPNRKEPDLDPYETREFPDGMIPGYTGYIPQRKYQHGDRYRVETDACLESTKAVHEQAKENIKQLQRTIAAYPKTASLNNATVVKHFLDYHRAYHPTEISQRADRRVFVEPPIPGYQGYIPRIRPTELGLGASYHETTKKGLNRFALETMYSTTNFPISVDHQTAPVDFTDHSNFTSSSMDFTQQRPKTTSSGKRLYVKPGMVPKYTGYLPQRKYRVGQTYGDTTRGLPVCSHSFANYADFVRSKSFLESDPNNDY